MESEITPEQAMNRDLAIELDGWKWWGAQNRDEAPRCRYLDLQPHGYTGHYDTGAAPDLILCSDWGRYIPPYADSGDGMLLLTENAYAKGYLTQLHQGKEGWTAIVFYEEGTDGGHFITEKDVEAPMALAKAVLGAIRDRKGRADE